GPLNHELAFNGAMTGDQSAAWLTWAGSNAATSLAVQSLYQMRWAQGTEIAAVTWSARPTMRSETPTILPALRSSDDDPSTIRAVMPLLDTPSAQAPLNLANLSQLYRYAILAQSLGLSISDLDSLIALTGINPFQLGATDPITDQTMRFVQAAQIVMASRFS